MSIADEAREIYFERRPAVTHAMEAALFKHGKLTEDHVRAALILMEESGEVAAAALTYTRSRSTMLEKANLITELYQVVATAMFMIHNLEHSDV